MNKLGKDQAGQLRRSIRRARHVPCGRACRARRAAPHRLPLGASDPRTATATQPTPSRPDWRWRGSQSRISRGGALWCPPPPAKVTEAEPGRCPGRRPRTRSGAPRGGSPKPLAKSSASPSPRYQVSSETESTWSPRPMAHNTRRGDIGDRERPTERLSTPRAPAEVRVGHTQCTPAC